MEFAIGFCVGLVVGFLLVMLYEAIVEDGPRGTRVDG